MTKTYTINGKKIEKLENLTLGTTTVENIKGCAVEVLRGENDKVFSYIVDKINELLEEILHKLNEIHSSMKLQMTYTNNPPPIINPNVNSIWCSYCGVYNCGEIHITCY